MTFAERNPRSTEARLRTVVLRQCGLVTVRQATEAGLSSAAVTRRVKAGVWERVLPGVYRVVIVETSGAQSALAAVLWAGTGAVASHRTVAALAGLDGVLAPTPDLWVPPDRRLRNDRVVVHRGEIEPVDRRMIGPIPVTSPARTLIDLAGVLGDEDLAAALEDAIHRGLTTPQSIARRLEALGGKGRPGAARLREIVGDRGAEAAAASRLEVRIWRTLRAAGLRPVRQHRVRVGDRTYFLDCAFPQWRLAVEGVGDRYHRSPFQRRRDQRRLADLVSISWHVMPVTWHDVTETPDVVAARVMRRLADTG